MPVSTNARVRSVQSSPGEEIVISGLAGYFPQSENVYQFRDNLFNKVDMVTEDDQRWKFDHHQVPKRAGKVPNITKFDASFFGINYKQAHTLDPLCRLLMERTYEAIVDAGVNPDHLKGQKIGVFVGACFSETEKFWYFEKPHENGYGLTGCLRAMYANQISYWLGITGPSYSVDTACSSSSYAFEQAYRAIRDGCCESAIVRGTQLSIHPYISLQFSQLGVLSPEGICKVFDNNANGYVRSETACVVFLQKARDAKRVYATVMHVKNNSDGFKDQGIFYPSRYAHRLLLEQCYQECGTDPRTVKYFEAHGTATKLVQEITHLKSWDEKLDHFISKLPALRNSAQHYKAVCVSVLDRIKAISRYEWDPKKTVKSQTTLLRPVAMAMKAEEDYGLSKCCEKKVEVHFVTGNHMTMLDSKDTAAVINRQLTNTEALQRQ